MRDFEDVDGDCNESQPRGDDQLNDFDWDLDEIDTDCKPDFVDNSEDVYFNPAHPTGC